MNETIIQGAAKCRCGHEMTVDVCDEILIYCCPKNSGIFSFLHTPAFIEERIIE